MAASRRERPPGPLRLIGKAVEHRGYSFHRRHERTACAVPRRRTRDNWLVSARLLYDNHRALGLDPAAIKLDTLRVDIVVELENRAKGGRDRPGKCAQFEEGARLDRSVQQSPTRRPFIIRSR